MSKNVYLYVLLKLLIIKNPYLLLSYLACLKNADNYKYFIKNFFVNKVSNSICSSVSKKTTNFVFNSLIPVELAVKNAIISEKPVYFLPINGDRGDTNLLNVYLNNFNPITNIELLLNNRKYRNIKKSVITKYNPSLLICINSFNNFKVIANVRTLGIPSIGLVDKTIINSPFEISIFVPSINSYFQFYYFFIIFKLVAYYKKLQLRLTIYNYINLKLIYLKKLWLLK